MMAGTVCATPRVSGGRARLSLHSGIRPWCTAVNPQPVSHITGRHRTRLEHSATDGEPELDFAGGRFRRIRPVHDVLLGDKCQVTADGAGGSLVDGVGAASE